MDICVYPQHSRGFLTYTREKLLSLQKMGKAGFVHPIPGELAALVRSDRTYREGNIMFFSETWLMQNIPVLTTVRAGRDTKHSAN